MEGDCPGEGALGSWGAHTRWGALGTPPLNCGVHRGTENPCAET